MRQYGLQFYGHYEGELYLSSFPTLEDAKKAAQDSVNDKLNEGRKP
ncbi:MAG: hypothetical protein HUJ26_12650 [Planctomycetaceae bacterium]|nr:hypothetical protein [Planctomycetaceae bacterium]